MGRPVVHFEIIGRDPDRLHGFYGDLFGWGFEPGDGASEVVSEPDRYGFVDGETAAGGINGGVGGGAAFEHRVLFYVGVPDVEAALAEAERLGGVRLLGPARTPANLVIGQFTDPEGNLVGVAGPR
jgi:predicted enzyme related to lactoylglutathione lyase